MRKFSKNKGAMFVIRIFYRKTKNMSVSNLHILVKKMSYVSHPQNLLEKDKHECFSFAHFSEKKMSYVSRHTAYRKTKNIRYSDLHI